MTYGVREHRFLLEDSLKTSKRISKEEYKKLLPKYRYYGYDNRINQIVYIANDIITEKYTWLYIKLNKKELNNVNDKKQTLLEIYEDEL